MSYDGEQILEVRRRMTDGLDRLNCTMSEP